MGFNSSLKTTLPCKSYMNNAAMGVEVSLLFLIDKRYIKQNQRLERMLAALAEERVHFPESFTHIQLQEM